jgi:transcriptional regulator with XRE-family HTH domain
MLTSEQVRGARAMLRIEQRDLAAAAGISLETVKRIERSPGAISALAATVEKIQHALERAGVEFISENGGGPGVRLEGQRGKTMASKLEPLRFAAASNLSVTLNSFDGEGPVVVLVERKALDDLFGLSRSTENQRIKIVTKNLDAISRVVEQRYAQRNWTERHTAGARVKQIVLRDADLRAANLKLPSE